MNGNLTSPRFRSALVVLAIGGTLVTGLWALSRYDAAQPGAGHPGYWTVADAALANDPNTRRRAVVDALIFPVIAELSLLTIVGVAWTLAPRR